MPTSRPNPVQRTPGLAERVVVLGAHALLPAVKGYWYVFTVLVVAGAAAFLAIALQPLGATIAGMIDPTFRQRFLDWPLERVRDIAWLLGAFVAAVGQPLGWIRIPGFWRDTSSGGRSAAVEQQDPSEAAQAEALEAAERAAALNSRWRAVRRPPGRALREAMSAAGAGAVFGLVVGIQLGITVAIMGASYALSPWATPDFAPLVSGSLNVPYGWVPFALIGGTPVLFGAVVFVLELVGGE